MAGTAKELKEIGARLRLTRLALGYDTIGAWVDTLEPFMRVTVQRWNNYEIGFTRPSVDVALALAARWEITLDWVFRGRKSDLPNRIVEALNAYETEERRRSAIRNSGGGTSRGGSFALPEPAISPRK